MPTALITNDDGIGSEGLRRLAVLARDAGFDPLVAAPWGDASGTGAGLTAEGEDGRVVTRRHELAGLDGVPAYAVRALPGYVTLLAVRGAFGPTPDVVLAGINLGPNLGRAVLHSGTVGAATTGALHGCCPALAASLDTADPDGARWDTAVAVAGRVLGWLAGRDGVLLNLNVPNLPLDQVRGIRRAGLTTFGAVETVIGEVGEGFVRVTVEPTGRELAPGTDAALLADGYATVTPLAYTREDRDVELPDFG